MIENGIKELSLLGGKEEILSSNTIPKIYNWYIFLFKYDKWSEFIKCLK